MFTTVLCTYLHYLGFITLFSTLILEHILLKPNIDEQASRKIILIDLIYGVSAALVLITGVLKVIYFGKTPEYYSQSTAFHIKIGLFFAVAILSIHPTLVFLKWKKQLKHNERLDQSPSTLKPLVMLIRVELLCVILIPLFAILMARGIY